MAASYSDDPLKESRRICSKYLGKSAAKNYLNIINDIKSVSSGIKPSFLYDYSAVTADNLRSLVDSLKKTGIIAQNVPLVVVVVDEDLFICHQQTVTKALDLKIINPSFIDISKCCQLPRLLSKEESMMHILHSQSSPHVQGVSENLDSHLEGFVKKLAGFSSSHLAPVVHLHLPKTINRTTVFGLFLGYPVIYWYRTNDEGETCLSMVPLRVYKLAGHIPSTSKGNDYNPNAHDFCTFSCPEVLTKETKEIISKWYVNIQKFTKSSIYDRITISSDVVTLPSVSL